MNLTKILTIVFFVIAIAAGYLLYNGIHSTIEEAKEIERIETTVKQKLELIRDAQVAYQGNNGDYADTWEKLIHFVDSGKIWTIQKTEKITMLAYGAEKSEFIYDTLGFEMVYDYLSKVHGNFNSKDLPELPHAQGKYFALYAKADVRNGVNVDYVEVTDTFPFDRTRKEDNDIKNRRPLKFGSKTEITTAGNWQ